jgi:hypothetical protein
MAEPGYETASEQLKRTGHADSVVCTDCGAFVMNVAAHTRFHSAMGALVRSADTLDVLTGTLAGVIAGHEAQEDSH